MEMKVMVLVVLVVTAGMLSCGSAQSIGSVQLINAVGEKVLMPLCSGPDGDHRGPGYIDFPGFQYFQFQVNVLSRGWRCQFEYTHGTRRFTADVLVWEGIYRAPETASLISVVPCINCIWKIQADGFYRADDKYHASFQRMAHWK